MTNEVISALAAEYHGLVEDAYNLKILSTHITYENGVIRAHRHGYESLSVEVNNPELLKRLDSCLSAIELVEIVETRTCCSCYFAQPHGLTYCIKGGLQIVLMEIRSKFGPIKKMRYNGKKFYSGVNYFGGT